MAQSDMLVIKRSYDFSKCLLQHSGKFSRSHRFSVAVKLENAALSLIELTSVANTRQHKLPLLKEANEALVKMRLLFRLSYEMRFIKFNSYEYVSALMNELGRLLGGWIKNPGKSSKQWISCGLEPVRNPVLAC